MYRNSLTPFFRCVLLWGVMPETVMSKLNKIMARPVLISKQGSCHKYNQLVNVSVGKSLFNCYKIGMDNFSENAQGVAGLDTFWATENLTSFCERQEKGDGSIWHDFKALEITSKWVTSWTNNCCIWKTNPDSDFNYCDVNSQKLQWVC